MITELFDEIFFVGKQLQEYREIPTVVDEYKISGPLSGIYSVLKHAKHPYVLVLSNDMPFISKSMIIEMQKRTENYPCEIVIPKHSNGIEPLHSIYNKKVLPKIQKLIESQKFSIRNLYSFTENHFFDVNLPFNANKIFYNINYPENLIEANKLYEQNR